MSKLVKNILEYTVIFEVAEEGGYIARVPILDDFATQSDTFEETVANVKDAIQGVIGVMKEEGLDIPFEKYETIFSKITVDYPFALS